METPIERDEPTTLELVLAWALTVVGLLVLKRVVLGDPPFWDEPFYLRAARGVEASLSLRAYASGPVVRPPFVAYLLGVAAHLGLGSLHAMRVVLLAYAALLVPAASRLVTALGGTARARRLAMLFVAASPLFIAQSGLILSDAAVAVPFAWAWVAILEGSLGLYLACAVLAVLSKESGYAVAVGASALLWLRAGRPRGVRALAVIAPAMIPIAALVAWLCVRNFLGGTAISSIDRSSIGYNHLDAALIHDLLEGGRFALLPLAAFVLHRAWRARELSNPRVITGALLLAFPFLFPGPLPRYMLPTLPLLAALAALAFEERPLIGAGYALAFTAYCAATLGSPSWHTNGGHHLDANLRYRRLLALQQRAALAIAAEHPRAVLVTFPMQNALDEPPADGFLSERVLTINAVDSLSIAQACTADLLVQSSHATSAAATAAKLDEAHARTPWLHLVDEDFEITVDRVRCAR